MSSVCLNGCEILPSASSPDTQAEDGFRRCTREVSGQPSPCLRYCPASSRLLGLVSAAARFLSSAVMCIVSLECAFFMVVDSSWLQFYAFKAGSLFHIVSFFIPVVNRCHFPSSLHIMLASGPSSLLNKLISLSPAHTSHAPP